MTHIPFFWISVKFSILGAFIEKIEILIFECQKSYIRKIRDVYFVERVQMYPAHNLYNMHRGLVSKHIPKFVTIGPSIPVL